MISDKRSVQDLLALLKRKGIQDVVISPGSRNAPLSISFDADPFFRCISIIDERSAAFFALGMAQQSHQPVVLACTSGSAALNYAPAVAEAHYQHVPLIVLTADRPPEWIDQGDGQTIRQNGVFGSHVAYSASLWLHGEDPDLNWHNQRMINEAILKCQEGQPVHLNIPFRESLYGQADTSMDAVKAISRVKSASMLHPDAMGELAHSISHSPKILVIAGMMRSDKELNEVLGRFAELENVAVLSETTSNLQHPAFIGNIDRLIMTFESDVEIRFQPDILITLGSQLISKKIKALLRKNKPAQHWHISEEPGISDTFQSLTHLIPVKPAVFFAQLLPGLLPVKSDYGNWLRERDKWNASNHGDYVKQAPWSDLKAFDSILRKIPTGSNVQMGNSSVVRYIQLFSPRTDLSYNGNRGTSGIDGCTSTAAGAAWERNAATTLISGDVAFLYDSNALWSNPISKHLRIIVINNGGGGIFRIIEGPKDSGVLEKYFETSHGMNMKQLCLHAGIRYRSASDQPQLEQGLDWLYKGRKSGILEVFTPSTENDGVLKSYFSYLGKHKNTVK